MVSVSATTFFACGKRTSARGLGSNVEIRYGSQFQLYKNAAVHSNKQFWSICGLLMGYSFRQLKPKKGTLQKQLAVNFTKSFSQKVMHSFI